MLNIGQTLDIHLSAGPKEQNPAYEKEVRAYFEISSRMRVLQYQISEVTVQIQILELREQTESSEFSELITFLEDMRKTTDGLELEIKRITGVIRENSPQVIPDGESDLRVLKIYLENLHDETFILKNVNEFRRQLFQQAVTIHDLPPADRSDLLNLEKVKGKTPIYQIIHTTKGKINSLLRQLIPFKKTLDDIEREYRQRTEKIEGELKEKRAHDRLQIMKKLEPVRSRLKDVETRLSEVQDSINYNEDDLKTCEKLLLGKRKKADQVSMQNQLEKVREGLSNLNAIKTELESEKEVLNERIDGLEKEIKNLEDLPAPAENKLHSENQIREMPSTPQNITPGPMPQETPVPAPEETIAPAAAQTTPPPAPQETKSAPSELTDFLAMARQTLDLAALTREIREAEQVLANIKLETKNIRQAVAEQLAREEVLDAREKEIDGREKTLAVREAEFSKIEAKARALLENLKGLEFLFKNI